MAEDQEEQWQCPSWISLSTNICHPPPLSDCSTCELQGGWWQMPGRSCSCLSASYFSTFGTCKSGALLSVVVYSKAFLGSSFQIHTCPSQTHSSEFLQIGVTDQLLCHSTSVCQDTLTRTCDNLRRKIRFIKHLAIFYVSCNSLFCKCPELKFLSCRNFWAVLINHY